MAALKFTINSMLLTLLALVVAFGTCNPLHHENPHSPDRRFPDVHTVPAQYDNVYGADKPIETGSSVKGRNAMAQSAAGTFPPPDPTPTLPPWEPEHRFNGLLPADTANFTPYQGYHSVVTQGTTFYYTGRDIYKPNVWKPTTTYSWEWQISKDRPWDPPITTTRSTSALFNTQNNAFQGILPAETTKMTPWQLYLTVVTKGTTFFYTDSDPFFGNQLWKTSSTIQSAAGASEWVMPSIQTTGYTLSAIPFGATPSPYPTPIDDPLHRMGGALPADTALFTPNQPYYAATNQGTTYYYSNRNLFLDKIWKPSTTGTYPWDLTAAHPWDDPPKTTANAAAPTKPAPNISVTTSTPCDEVKPKTTSFLTSMKASSQCAITLNRPTPYTFGPTKTLWATTRYLTSYIPCGKCTITRSNGFSAGQPHVDWETTITLPSTWDSIIDACEPTSTPKGHSTPRPSIRNAEPEPIIPTMPVGDSDPDNYPLPTAVPAAEARSNDDVPGHLEPEKIPFTWIGRGTLGHHGSRTWRGRPRPTYVCDGCAIE